MPDPTLLTPNAILKRAIQAVPAVKYALGVAGIAAVVAIVAGLKVDLRIMVVGIPFVLVLMVLLVVFGALAKTGQGDIQVPALVLCWAVLILTIFSAALSTSSFFFEWPKPMRYYLDLFGV